MGQGQGSHLNKAAVVVGLGGGVQILGWSPPDVGHITRSPHLGWVGGGAGRKQDPVIEAKLKLTQAHAVNKL